MFPSTRQGVLLYVSDRHGRATAFDGGAARIVTRSPEALQSGGVPAADCAVIDATVLDPQPPPWLDTFPGDAYVLAGPRTTLPDWVVDADVSTLDPALVSLLTGSGVGDRDDEDTRLGRTDAGTDGTDESTGGTDASTGGETARDDPAGSPTAAEGDDAYEPLSVVPFPVALLDDDGTIKFVNEAWVEFGRENGRGREESDVGTNYFELCERANDSFASSATKAIQRVLAGDVDSEQVEYPCHGDGERRWYAMAVVAVEADGPAEVALVHQDVSQYRQHINVLDRVLRHNLRNKANIILGHAAALASDRDDETATAATTIGAAARELLSLSEQARRYREVSTDDRPTTAIDVVSVVSEVTERLSRNYSQAVVETSLPVAALVQATQSLSLVVHEVVENAIVHNDRPDPWVRVEVVRVHEGGDERVSIRVADDGPGIPPEDRRLLTGGLEEHPIRHGSQLGVWVVSSLVTSLNGTVSVEPRTPRGSVVTMTFPSATSDAGR
jgi:signal transduction histidine kinase